MDQIIGCLGQLPWTDMAMVKRFLLPLRLLARKREAGSAASRYINWKLQALGIFGGHPIKENVVQVTNLILTRQASLDAILCFGSK